MDIEGAEMKALKGAEQTLIKFRPQLAISIYHSNNDMQDIPIYLHNILKNYIFKIGQYSPDNDETILYARYSGRIICKIRYTYEFSL